jgi:hypothetical protein
VMADPDTVEPEVSRAVCNHAVIRQKKF